MRIDASTPSTKASLGLTEFEALLKEAHDRWVARKPLLDALIARKPLAIFGFGGKGQFLAQHIRQYAQIDIAVYDTAPEKRALAAELGFRTIGNLGALTGGGWAIILGACQAQIEQQRIIPTDYIYFQEAACLFKAPHLANLTSDFSECVLDNLNRLHNVYEIIHKESRECFIDVLRFRLSADPKDLASTRSSVSEMWLDIPMRYRKRPYHVVLDVGAYDGDTLRSFRESFKSERAIAVEANTQLFDKIREVGSSYPRGIAISPKAAWSRDTRLKFEEVRFGMVQVTESSDGSLDAAPLDSSITEEVNFVKMDIEGAESEALTGSQNLLQRWQPDLAIAVYHRPEDVFLLCDQITSLGYDADRFSWYFGHHSDCVDDSIFYICKK
jgi:FkbM family methyltransferase